MPLLKEDNETRLIPIVIMTALDGIDDRIKGIEAGAMIFSPSRSINANYWPAFRPRCA